MDDIKKEALIRKAQQLRYKKPLVKELNLDEIHSNLYEMSEACGNVRWYLGDQAEELSDLLGEDDASEFEASFSALYADIERLQQDLNDIWLPDYFNDYMAAVIPPESQMLGYDSYEEDYFQLGSWEANIACREAAERMTRKTKKELIECAHTVISVIVAYMAIKYRFDSLSAAADVLMEKSEKELRAVKEIEEAYQKAAEDNFKEWYESTRNLDRLLRDLPDKMWIE